MSTSQGMRMIHKNSMASEKEIKQINTSSTSVIQVWKCTQEVETMAPSATGSRLEQRSGYLSSSLGISESEGGSFNNTTYFQDIWEKSFVTVTFVAWSITWSDIKQENLNHMWAAIEHKVESVDMNEHRDHILGWMNELWNKWRGHLHSKYVKDMPLQQSLKNVPRGVDKKEWKWLVKEHFSSESFQAKSSRNTTNRAKLRMLHHIGSKPIREIIYQKGGNDGNPPDLATIFFETRKKDNKLVEPESIEKHAQLEEMVQEDPSLPTIEIVD